LTKLVWTYLDTKSYTITESKAQLSALVQQVMETGEMVVIGKHGRPMVKLMMLNGSGEGLVRSSLLQQASKRTALASEFHFYSVNFS
jgi:prevent-host-death family protein